MSPEQTQDLEAAVACLEADRGVKVEMLQLNKFPHNWHPTTDRLPSSLQTVRQ